MRIFTPLNGEEITKILLAEIKRSLESDSGLHKHIAYPRVVWSWKLELNVVPSDQSRTLEASGDMVQSKTLKDGTIEDFDAAGLKEEHIEIAAPERLVDTPDAVREQEGLPLSEQPQREPTFARRVEVGRAAENPTRSPRLNRE